jgi:hypothetical protein
MFVPGTLARTANGDQSHCGVARRRITYYEKSLNKASVNFDITFAESCRRAIPNFFIPVISSQLQLLFPVFCPYRMFEVVGQDLTVTL